MEILAIISLLLLILFGFNGFKIVFWLWLIAGYIVSDFLLWPLFGISKSVVTAFWVTVICLILLCSYGSYVQSKEGKEEKDSSRNLT